jgi:hypothetical protein
MLLIKFKRSYTIQEVSRALIAMNADVTWNYKQTLEDPLPNGGYGSLYGQASVNIGLVLRDFDTATETWNTFDPDTSEDTDWVLWRECERWRAGSTNIMTTAAPPDICNTLLCQGGVGNGGHADPATPVYGVLVYAASLGAWMPDAPDGDGDAVFHSATMTNAVGVGESLGITSGAADLPG